MKKFLFFSAFLVCAILYQPAHAEETQENTLKSFLSRYQVEFYGRLQLDIIYDDSISYPGPYLLYGETEQFHHDDNQFFMTANSSRLGLKIGGPQRGDRKLWGLIEIDFQGEPEKDEPDPLLRHAFLVYEINRNWQILAGQTWDVISPLQIPLLNWAPGWSWGNIGFWHPQLRLTYKNSFIEAALAMSKPHEGDEDGGGIDDGQDAGWPNIQGRIGFTFDKVAFGFSGHYGEQEIDYMDFGERYIETWSGNFDLAVDVKEWLKITGEFFIGENLDGYMGGVLQGIHIYTNNKGEIVREGYQAIGGWLNFGFAKNKWKTNWGGSIDVVNDYKLYPGSRTPGDIGDRGQNMVFWMNFTYEIFDDLVAGLEFSHTETLYYNARKGEPNRTQISLIYSF